MPKIALAQRVGVSTDVVVLSTLSPNFEVEINDSQKSSIAFDASFNVINSLGNVKFKHISISPEYRWWLRQIMSSHYIGLEGRYTTYDLQMGSKAWRGDVISLGLNYGYAAVISERLNIVPYVGVGYGVKCSYGDDSWRGSGVLPSVGVKVQYIVLKGRKR